MFKNLLPIGSVILLKGGIKKLMIIGITPVVNEGTEDETTYDYIGVLYPEGFIGNNTNLLFNHADINDVIFKGYDNPEREEFIDMLDEAYEKREMSFSQWDSSELQKDNESHEDD